VAFVPGRRACPLVKNPDDPCPHLLEGVINVIGDKWSILVIGTLGNFGILRFQELKNKLEGISPKTLTDKLRRLEKVGLVNRQSFNEVPPRVQYSLTRGGESLRAALNPLLQWAAKKDHA
jgi:DNA-binding HxlR family transcriptional regulator